MELGASDHIKESPEALEALAVAVLELLATTAGAEVIAPNGVGCLSRRATLCFKVFCTSYFVTLLVVLRGRTLCLRGSFTNLYLTGSLLFSWSDVEANAHQDGSRLAVHLFDHSTEELIGLELVDEERILVFVAGVLYRVTQLVHLT